VTSKVRPELIAPSIRAADIATRIVGPAAEEVDRDARFPVEAIDALREARLLSSLIPEELGGEGVSLAEVGRVVEALGRQCSSTAMIYAMHQIQVASLVQHGRNPGLRAFLADVADRQLLLASATTEIGIGGDVRSSSCHVARDGDTFTLEKNAPVISYGAHADAVLATARRTVDSPPSDQVLVVCRPPGLRLDQTGEWDTLGFRGTCSPGFMLHASGPTDLILDDPYGDISSQTMLPVSHTLWGSVWLGIAAAALAKARKYVQAAARKSPGVTPPGALRLAEAAAVHQQFTELVHGSISRYENAGPDDLASPSFAVAMNTLKVSASGLVVDVVGRALLITGISGYREDTPYRLGRQLRDAYGAALMVNNDRIVTNTAQLLLVARGE
jgi:acyl-CoA dehydrogenase